MDIPPLVIITVLFVLLMSFVIHEVAHAWVADKCGDPTAKEMGRITLNPIAHIDLWMTILLPILCLVVSGGRLVFGGAKPVPVNPMNYRKPMQGDILVSMAGPASNFVIAFLLGILMRVFAGAVEDPFTNAAVRALGIGIFFNLLLGAFNLIPIPPLDGSHVLAWILPKEWRRPYRSLGSIGIIIVLVVVLNTRILGTVLVLIAGIYSLVIFQDVDFLWRVMGFGY